MSSRARYAVGIDLGTTNSVVAFIKLGEDSTTAAAPFELLPIPQLVAPATVENRPALPSFLYLAPAAENHDAYRLPWTTGKGGPDFAAGEFARRQSADAPTRTVAAAKSWLAHSRVDRHQPILPWDAPADEVAKISPVEASRRYLAHLAAAWNAAHPDAPLADQQIVLTVPASFDASARELTREAALAAGLPADLILSKNPRPRSTHGWPTAATPGARGSPPATRSSFATSAAARRIFRSSASRRRAATSRCNASPSATTSSSAATTWTSRSPSRHRRRLPKKGSRWTRGNPSRSGTLAARRRRHSSPPTARKSILSACSGAAGNSSVAPCPSISTATPSPRRCSTGFSPNARPTPHPCAAVRAGSGKSACRSRRTRRSRNTSRIS